MIANYARVDWDESAHPEDATEAFERALAQCHTIFVPERRTGTLSYSPTSKGNLKPGNYVRGASSGAVARIIGDQSGSLTVAIVSGEFNAGEILRETTTGDGDYDTSVQATLQSTSDFTIAHYPVRNIEIRGYQTILCESAKTTIKGVDPYSTLLVPAIPGGLYNISIRGGNWQDCGRIIDIDDRTVRCPLFDRMIVRNVRAFKSQGLVVQTTRSLQMGDHVRAGANRGEVWQASVRNLDRSQKVVVRMEAAASDLKPGSDFGPWDSSDPWEAEILSAGAAQTVDGAAFRFSDVLMGVWRECTIDADTDIAVQFVGTAGGSAGQSNGNTIEGCYLFDCSKHAIFIDPSLSGDQKVNGLTIRDCIIEQTGSSGVLIAGTATAVRIQNCYFEANALSGGYDIDILPGSGRWAKEVLIESNTFSAASQAASARIHNGGNSGFTARDNAVTDLSPAQPFAEVAGLYNAVQLLDNWLAGSGKYAENLFQQSGGSNRISWSSFYISNGITHDLPHIVHSADVVSPTTAKAWGLLRYNGGWQLVSSYNLDGASIVVQPDGLAVAFETELSTTMAAAFCGYEGGVAATFGCTVVDSISPQDPRQGVRFTAKTSSPQPPSWQQDDTVTLLVFG